MANEVWVPREGPRVKASLYPDVYPGTVRQRIHAGAVFTMNDEVIILLFTHIDLLFM